ncbi:MAG: hypothetical protein ACR2JB_18660 [Bryobacteraceae bacterium]
MATILAFRGLLQPSFHPAQQVCALRSLLRHSDSLVQMASAYAQRIQKALDQMTSNRIMSSAISRV